MVGVKYYRLIL